MSIEEEDEDGCSTTSQWLLGFVSLAEHPTSLLRHRFPSKVGGRPAWLDPVNLPSGDELKSKISGQPLDFLLQVYCPLDDKPAAFHRTIYLFVPQNGREMKRPSVVRAFRCQLPRQNDWYAFEPSREKYPQEVTDADETVDPWRVLAAERCLKDNVTPPHPAKRHTYPEQNLLIDVEEAPEGPAIADQATTDDDSWQPSDVAPDVEAAIASTSTADQKHFAEFAARVSWDPEQVLRYCFQDGAKPLWPNPSPVPTDKDIPPCQTCSGRRKFEFQVMPQLLSSLEIDDERESSLDWASLAVYTCANSCKTKGAYAEEFVWVQT